LDITFKSHKLEKEYNDLSLLVRHHGAVQAKLLRRRLDELRAVDSLKDMRSLPRPRCHELKGNLAGKLSVDLDGPYRLILEPANEPKPLKDDGGLDWSRVTAVRVLGIEDTHE
jgi:plasmid maintenance system killer protein